MTTRRKIGLRIVLWAAVVAWMVFIFHFSAEKAEKSQKTSGEVVRCVLTVLDEEFPTLPAAEQEARIEKWSFPVRKLAHFCLFAMLGSLCFAAFSVDLPPRRAFPASLGLGAARAVLDEVHQSFVPGRSCELRDMGIDFAGVLLGAAFLLLILLCIKRRNSQKARKAIPVSQSRG